MNESVQNRKCEEKVKRMKKSTWAAEEMEASVSLISHGALLPRAVLAAAVLTDEA